jgi:galactose mutarotase-like enzyme
MYFSVGGHPAFKVPLEEDRAYTDYYLEFENPEDAGRWPISKDGLIEAVPVPILKGRKIPLDKKLFQQDALVFKKLASQSISLKSDHTPHGIEFSYKGFPYLGIWAAKNADFVCIEPWCGIADSVNTSQQLREKEGINSLEPEQYFIRSWSVKLL